MRPVLLDRAGRNDDGLVFLEKGDDFGVGHLAKKNGRWLHAELEYTTMSMDRRDFLKTSASAAVAASAGLAAHDAVAAEPGRSADPDDAARGSPVTGPMPGPQKLTEKGRLNRIASCSYPIRSIFKSRAGGRGGGGGNPATQELKKKYGEITMLDFPQWTQGHVPRRHAHGHLLGADG